MSHTYQHIQDKPSELEKYSGQMGLKISVNKTEVMTLNVNNPGSILLDGKTLPHVDTFTYLDTTVTTNGGAGCDIKRRLSKERSALYNLQGQYTIPTKLKLYSSCVLPVLLYGSE
ncbi:uncharacterized protein [Mytilus edulis]|uniref:uncharacterized protein n=1 Tax=Mytilus edulis TaxID=6550 RepID=UPI0039EF4A77